MKILAISVRVPEEGKKGDQVLSFHRLSYLSRQHTIKLICFGSPQMDATAISKLEAMGISVQLIHWNKFVAFFNLLIALYNSSLPFQCAIFKSGTYKNAVLEALTFFKPDLLYAVMIRSLVNLPHNGLPLYVDMVDSMGLNFSRRIVSERGLKLLAYKIECRRVSEYEYKAAQLATLSFVVSKVDQKFISNIKVKSLPLGINGGEFNNQSLKSTDPVVIFSGNMNYKPNIDAVLWFYKHCWIHLKIAVPNLRWIIAGSNPASEVLALKNDVSITVTGRVPSLAAVINSAWVSIAPMQSGSGMQFKILEAMACGVPVVTTSLGLGDIAAISDNHLIVADSSDSFVSSILKLIGSQELCQSISNSGMRFVNDHHTWDAINAEFDKFIVETIKV